MILPEGSVCEICMCSVAKDPTSESHSKFDETYFEELEALEVENALAMDTAA